MLGKGKKHSGYRKRASGLFLIPRVTRAEGLFAVENDDDIFTDFLNQLSKATSFPMDPGILEHPDTGVNYLVHNYGAVIVLIDSSNRKICYSINFRNTLPSEFTDRLRTDMGIMPSDTILWSNDVFTDGQAAPAREVLWGEDPKATARRAPSRAAKAKQWQHPEELSPEELKYLMGNSEEPPT